MGASTGRRNSREPSICGGLAPTPTTRARLDVVHRPRGGLGDRAACVRIFNELRPYAEQLASWRADFSITSPDGMAIAIAWDGLQTTAFHFTRRRYFYADVAEAQANRSGSNKFLGDRAEAIAAFEDLSPFVMMLCWPLPTT